MKPVVPNPPPGFDELSVEEQIRYVDALWDRISAARVEAPLWQGGRSAVYPR